MGSPIDSLVNELGVVLRETLPAGEPIGVALSGGPDSVALVALLREACGDAALHLFHVDHRAGPHAAQAAEHCAQLARAWELPLHIGLTRGSGPRSETRLREERWDGLADLARGSGVRQLLLAHHADDAIETIGLRLLRGHRGARSLAGLPQMRTHAGGLAVLRPLLLLPGRCPRRRLATALRQRSLEAVQDPSNRDLSVPRSRLRAELAERPELSGRLESLRGHSRRRLHAQLDLATSALEREWARCGRGLRLGRAALDLVRSDLGQLAETLGLLAATLERPRRLSLGLAQLRRMATQLEASRGQLVLDAPSGLVAELRRDGLHFATERLCEESVSASVVVAHARRPWIA